MELLEQIRDLLVEIRDLLAGEPAPGDARAADPTCPCARRLGRPASNCPICRGTGEA